MLLKAFAKYICLETSSLVSITLVLFVKDKRGSTYLFEKMFPTDSSAKFSCNCRQGGSINNMYSCFKTLYIIILYPFPFNNDALFFCFLMTVVSTSQHIYAKHIFIAIILTTIRNKLNRNISLKYIIKQKYALLQSFYPKITS